MARIIPIPIGPIYPGGPCRGIIHVIQKGDTLYQLGKRYHVSVAQLMFANPFVDVYNLQIGDELCIPATISPRDVGAGERQQDLNNRGIFHGPETPDDGDGWENQRDWDEDDDQEDWELPDRNDDYRADGSWEDQGERVQDMPSSWGNYDGQEDWDGSRKQESKENWGDWQDQEDWNRDGNV